MKPSDLLKGECLMSIHLLAGQFLDQGWPMDIVQKALYLAVEELPSLEEDLSNREQQQ